MADEPQSLETSELDEPNLDKIVEEMEMSQADSSRYLSRIAISQAFWQCEWDGMMSDGRVDWRFTPDRGCWDGSSDSRLRIVETIAKEHVTLDLVAFWSARVQCKSIRPFVHGRDVNISDRMLQWRVYTHMKRELLNELPTAFLLKHALGLSFLGVEWEQQRERIDVPVTLDMIAQITAALGLGMLTQQILDPDKFYDKELIKTLQAMSPIMTTDDARGILNDLRNTGQAQIPTAQLRINKPKWTTLRPCMDVLFPSETVDFQRARWSAIRELVSESELEDRIVTDNYDPDFVTEAVKHKGDFAAFTPRSTPENQAGHGSNRDMIELFTFRMRYLDNGVPCMYRTVFNDATRGKDNLYAIHQKDPYDHGQHPAVALRRSFNFRPLLTSIGIADESYTDEMDMKRQQDGINDLSDLRTQPPMIVPTLRAQATKNAYGPRAVMTAMQPNQVSWAPLPPYDQMPVLVMQQIEARLDRRYAIIGGAIDPEIKAVRRQQLAQQCLGEIELALEMTFQLMQQYETDAEVQEVAGKGSQPWQFGVKDIQGKHNISATIDMKLIDIEQAKAKMQLLAEMMPFKQAGGLVFQAAAQIIDPDLADALTADQMSPTAQEREIKDAYSDMAQIMAGIEPQKNAMANAQLRIQTINTIVQQPNVMMKLQQDPVAQKLFQNYLNYYMLQIQQYQNNPQIGRSLATTAFSPSTPAQTTTAPAG